MKFIRDNIVVILVLILLIIIIVGIIIFIKKTLPKIKQKKLMKKINKTISKLPKDKYIIMDNLLLKYKDYTHQIDYLILSRYGIFVIEMKNYSGTIIGDEYKDNWLNIMGKKKHYFLNPIYQNHGHIKVLESLFKLNGDIYRPIVCFSDKVDIQVTSKKDIVDLDNLVNCIEKYKKVVNYYNIDELKEIIDNLDLHKKSGKTSDNMTCPKCGNRLVVRNGEYGEFLGCSNYPNCKYTRNK